MGERYIISGAQIGLLKVGGRAAEDALKEIEEKQFVGRSDRHLYDDANRLRNASPKLFTGVSIRRSSLRDCEMLDSGWR